MNATAIAAADAAQAQRLAIMNSYAADAARGHDHPLSCEARKARIEAAAQASMARQRDLSEARRLVRKAGIRSNAELLTALQNVLSAISTSEGSDLAIWRDALGEMCVEIEGEAV